jgi:hypothetical protein
VTKAPAAARAAHGVVAQASLLGNLTGNPSVSTTASVFRNLDILSGFIRFLPQLQQLGITPNVLIDTSVAWLLLSQLVQ